MVLFIHCKFRLGLFDYLLLYLHYDILRKFFPFNTGLNSRAEKHIEKSSGRVENGDIEYIDL